MADISSITLPNGSTYDLKDTSKVPVYGLGKNLIDNWYFLGDGSSRGIFPVNQRRITTTPSTSDYFIDRWKTGNFAGYSLSLTANGMVFTNSGSNNVATYQTLNNSKELLGKRVCYSILTSTGLYKNTGVLPASFNDSGGQISVSDGTNVIGHLYVTSYSIQVRLRSPANSGSLTFIAAKLELGREQTLAHLEGSSWVLNEHPDYEEELLKCQISIADGNDTYANKTVANEQEMAYSENGTTASRAYAIGEYFFKNGLPARAKTAISSGATFTEGTNYDVLPGGGLNDLAPIIAGINGNSSIILDVPYFAAGLIATARSTTGHASLAFVTAAAVVPLAQSASITYSLSSNKLTISNGTVNAINVYIYNFSPVVKITV